MLVSETCARCLYEKQAGMTDDPRYLADIRAILDNRRETDSAPYMVYLFNQAYEKYFGASRRYAPVKKQCNDLVLAMEDRLRRRIGSSPDPLAAALACARIGNYIDFGAMDHVDGDAFEALFADADLKDSDLATYRSFLAACASGRSFLLVCDNSGEIVLDRLLIEEVKKRFPHLSATALVRGGEALNDATEEDALYVGMDRVARVVSSGAAVAGTVYELMNGEGRAALDGADVILAKGQGNYESLSQQGRHVFYAFLCKCDLFTQWFHVPRLMGLLIEENPASVT